MTSLGKLGMVCMLAAAMTLVGCKETYKLTFTNVSSQASPLEFQGPDGFQDLGTLSPGSSAKETVKVDQDELPANCQVKAGALSKQFTLRKDGKKELSFYIEDKEIVGPVDKKMQIKKAERTEIKGMTSTPKEVVTGEPAGEPAKDSGGGTAAPVGTHEVVE